MYVPENRSSPLYDGKLSSTHFSKPESFSAKTSDSLRVPSNGNSLMTASNARLTFASALMKNVWF